MVSMKGYGEGRKKASLPSAGHGDGGRQALAMAECCLVL